MKVKRNIYLYFKKVSFEVGGLIIVFKLQKKSFWERNKFFEKIYGFIWIRIKIWSVSLFKITKLKESEIGQTGPTLLYPTEFFTNK